MNRDLDQLEAAAAKWAGTPFCERSAKRGVGVCCHALPLEIYFDAGWFERFDYPMAAPRSAHVQTVEDFLATRSELISLQPEVVSQPGDTLHFRLGRTSHFILQLRTHYIHAVFRGGALYAPSLPPSWLSRLHCIWRPT